SYMFHMMNEARLGVGLGATALGYTGYLKSLRYARERQQGRAVTATAHPGRCCGWAPPGPNHTCAPWSALSGPITGTRRALTV
ncbi:hypothetical protein, partial [Nocardia farcinica]|uniref:hypothetical protein n=1 Tax=Nocardia farcinica TaxID=37329 RepID=UPI002454A993